MSAFDASIPVEPQLNNYSCSVGATYWCLQSIGLTLTQRELEDIMVPNLVTETDGLRDGSGATIAALLRDRYGLPASNVSPVSFDQLCARAGQQPIAIGGSRWYTDPTGSTTGHWVAVRAFDGTQLTLANPGGNGPHFGQQTLDRSNFEQRGPFSAVWISLQPAARFVVANTGGQGANLRSEPSTTGAVVASVTEGAQVSAADHAWRHVTDPSGAQGWIATDYLIAVDGGFHVANTGGSGANLRPQPTTQSVAIKLISEGSTVTGDPHAWRQVTESSGASGWIADEFLMTQN
jgi:SH3-like domain-containing protein